MAIASVEQWIIAGKPYNEGVGLLKSISKDTTLIEMLEEGPDEYNRLRLFEELSACVKAIQKPADPGGASGESDKSFKAYSELRKEKWDSVHFPEEVKQKSIRTGELTTKINYHRHQLEDIPTQEKRLEFARIIVAAAKERADLYRKVDYFQNHGRLPEEEAKPKLELKDIVITSADVHREYMNVLSNISKAKKKNNQKKLTELIARREELKRALGI